MDTNQLLDSIPFWLVYLLTVVLAMLMVEVGFRLGRYGKKRAPGEHDLGTIVGAAFGLMSFFLVFMIGIAGNRFDNRRQLAIEEANAVRTVYLRSGYLDEPYQAEIRQLLLEYVDIRIAAASDATKLGKTIVRSNEIHAELWGLTEELARANSSVETVALFIDSVNEVISVHTERLMAVSLRIPTSVWGAIFVAIFLALGLLGFQNGLTGDRRLIAVAILIFIFSGVVLLLVDLDRPAEGLFNVSQQAMIDLFEQMSH